MATSLLTTSTFGLDAPAPSSPAEPKAPAPQAVATKTLDVWDYAVPVLAIAAVIAGWRLIVAVVGDGSYNATSAPTVPVEGVTIFAVFFVAAAGLERLLEPFNVLWGRSKTSAGAAVQAVSAAVADYKEKLAAWQAADPVDTAGRARAKAAADAAATVVDEKLAAAADASAAAAASQGRKAVFVWALATVFGMLASASLKLYLLKHVGIAAPPRELEVLATGLIIGAGTKPLHDLLKLIEQKKESAAPAAAS